MKAVRDRTRCADFEPTIRYRACLIRHTCNANITICGNPDNTFTKLVAILVRSRGAAYPSVDRSLSFTILIDPAVLEGHTFASLDAVFEPDSVPDTCSTSLKIRAATVREQASGSVDLAGPSWQADSDVVLLGIVVESLVHGHCRVKPELVLLRIENTKEKGDEGTTIL